MTCPLAMIPWPSVELHVTLRLVGDSADTSGGAINSGTGKMATHIQCALENIHITHLYPLVNDELIIKNNALEFE